MEDEINITNSRAKELIEQRKFLSKIEALGVKLSIYENNVNIFSENAMDVLLVKNAIQAFNRGFDPRTAILLLDDDYDLAVINIKDYSSSSKRQKELKGRVIGRRGMIKNRLSKATSCYIKIFGKTISIIGGYQNLDMAVAAVEMLLNGAKHDRVFSMIDRRKLDIYGNGNS
jgi:ribosomal RNA assembly protein